MKFEGNNIWGKSVLYTRIQTTPKNPKGFILCHLYKFC